MVLPELTSVSTTAPVSTSRRSANCSRNAASSNVSIAEASAKPMSNSVAAPAPLAMVVRLYANLRRVAIPAGLAAYAEHSCVPFDAARIHTSPADVRRLASPDARLIRIRMGEASLCPVARQHAMKLSARTVDAVLPVLCSIDDHRALVTVPHTASTARHCANARVESGLTAFAVLRAVVGLPLPRRAVGASWSATCRHKLSGRTVNAA
eukprot:1989420-Prymnesium_polylepis.1